MQFDLVLWNYASLLLLLIYFIGSDCKKKKETFTFEALMAGMNSKEKEMFKEELNKEVKRFRATQQKHHKLKVKQPITNVRRAPNKKRKIKMKLPKFLPGICDPICAHQCVHGCDFRCCIPGYQQSHRIPRPPPTVVLPGSCSPTCSPTCRPLCEEKCCAGGMFQSAKDLVTLNSQVCPSGCSKACLPRCTVSCCVAHISDANPSSPANLTHVQKDKKHLDSPHPSPLHRIDSPHPPPLQHIDSPHPPPLRHFPTPNAIMQAVHVLSSQFHRINTPNGQPNFNAAARLAQNKAAQKEETKITSLFLRRPQAFGIVTLPNIPNAYLYAARTPKCPIPCPNYCTPTCTPTCCLAGRRNLAHAQNMLRLQNMRLLQPQLFRQQKKTIPASIKTNIPLSKMHCPAQCFASCKPNCEVRCCNLQPNVLNQLNRGSIQHPVSHILSASFRPHSLNFIKTAGKLLPQSPNKIPGMPEKRNGQTLDMKNSMPNLRVTKSLPGSIRNGPPKRGTAYNVHPNNAIKKVPVTRNAIVKVIPSNNMIAKAPATQNMIAKVPEPKNMIAKGPESKNAIVKVPEPKIMIPKVPEPKKVLVRYTVPKIIITVAKPPVVKTTDAKTAIPKVQQTNTTLPINSSVQKKSNIVIKPPVPNRPPAGLIIKKSSLPPAVHLPKPVVSNMASNAVKKSARPVSTDVHKAVVIPVIPGNVIKQSFKPNVAMTTNHQPHPIVKMVAKKYIVNPQSPVGKSTANHVDVKTANHVDVKNDELLMTALKSADDSKMSIATPTIRHINQTTLPTDAVIKSTTPSHAPLVAVDIKKSDVSPNSKESGIATVAKKLNISLDKPKPSADVKKSSIAKTKVTDNERVEKHDIVKKTDILISPTCPHQCPNICAPLCDRGCCNRQIVFQAFHKTVKKSKIAFQLERLK